MCTHRSRKDTGLRRRCISTGEVTVLFDFAYLRLNEP